MPSSPTLPGYSRPSLICGQHRCSQPGNAQLSMTFSVLSVRWVCSPWQQVGKVHKSRKPPLPSPPS